MPLEIVAEVAQGFEGRPEQARLLVKAAAAAGADAVKFQIVYADELATPDYKYHGLFRSLEMEDAVWEGLASLSGELGIRLYADIFGTRSLQLAERVGIPAIKLHGTDIANLALLEEVAGCRIGKVLLGAGGAFRVEIEQACRALQGKELAVLLGFQGYPTPTDTNQIARVRLLSGHLSKLHPQISVGFADHAPPDDPQRYALAATAIGAGAQVLEKHLTLGRNMKLEDHESALNPDEFAEFCAIARHCWQAFGEACATADWGMSSNERAYREMIRRHVVARRDLAAGTRIAPMDVVLKRSAEADPLTDLEDVYGRILQYGFGRNQPLNRRAFD